MDRLVVEHVSKEFFSHGKTVKSIVDVSFEVRSGEFLTIIGPSGCGKSTLLNIIAGLMVPSKGQIKMDGEVLQGVNLKVGYMTQKDTLLPWKSVLANVTLPLEIRGMAKKERHEIAMKWIAKVGLTGFEQHYPNELSGGMLRRVLLCRTLVYRPEVILMDEPFSAVDAQTKIVLENELLRLIEGSGLTVVFVTHDIAEAVSLSDRVIVMTARPGRVKSVYNIDLPRPRDITQVQYSPAFLEIHHKITEDLRSEWLLSQEAESIQ